MPIGFDPADVENETDDDHNVTQDIDAIGIDSDVDDLPDLDNSDCDSGTDGDTGLPAHADAAVHAAATSPSGDMDSFSGDDVEGDITSLPGT